MSFDANKEKETNNSRGGGVKEKGVAKKTERAFRSQHRVLLSFVSQPQGQIYVRMSRVAGDAFNAAASDDTDSMRQPDGRTERQTTYGLPLMPSLHGAVYYMFRSLISLANTAQKNSTANTAVL